MTVWSVHANVNVVCHKQSDLHFIYILYFYLSTVSLMDNYLHDSTSSAQHHWHVVAAQNHSRSQSEMSHCLDSSLPTTPANWRPSLASVLLIKAGVGHANCWCQQQWKRPQLSHIRPTNMVWYQTKIVWYQTKNVYQRKNIWYQTNNLGNFTKFKFIQIQALDIRNSKYPIFLP